jgi:serine/threonine protein kinase
VTERSWGLSRGDALVEDCTVVRVLGGGRAYEVFEAFDDRMLVPVVVKVVRPHLTDDPGTLRGLQREVDLLGRLNHPVVVRGFHARTQGPRPYVALEFLPGPRLSTLIRTQGPLPLEQVLPLAVELCTALHYLHACEVVHLDVKPSNIIMDATPRLIDLSVARSVAAAAALDHPVGTDRYMAPEQCAPAPGARPGPASDVWGLGATLYEAAFGFRPFPDSDETPHPQREAEPLAPPTSHPSAVVEAFMACLHPDPAQRPSPAQLLATFAAAREDLPRPRIGFFRPRAR